MGDKGGGEHKHHEIWRGTTGQKMEAAKQRRPSHLLPTQRRERGKPIEGMTQREGWRKISEENKFPFLFAAERQVLLLFFT